LTTAPDNAAERLRSCEAVGLQILNLSTQITAQRQQVTAKRMIFEAEAMGIEIDTIKEDAESTTSVLRMP
jgi:hypothetical protein